MLDFIDLEATFISITAGFHLIVSLFCVIVYSIFNKDKRKKSWELYEEERKKVR